MRVADLSTVSRIALDFNGTVIDSTTSPDAIDWTTLGSGQVLLKLGAQAIDPGVYMPVVVVFDVANPDGAVWGLNNPLEVEIVS